MEGVHTHFGGLDWVVLIGYLLLTTWVGHRLRGKQSSIKDFFLAGRSLPWPAVCGSIIATEISAVTFIGVPGAVMAIGGDFTYLQWAIGSIIGRAIVGIYFVPAFYEQHIYSPYDYMASRLGEGVKGLATALFMIGSVLGQSVRVIVPALVLRTVTGLGMVECIVIISVFAVLWTWMGGMTTVIWTDVMQFFLFVGAGMLSLVWILSHLPGGWGEYFAVASEAGKFRVIDLRMDPAVHYTLWVALLAMPFQNVAAFGTDQLNAQRMFCCRSAGDARKAIIFSSFGQIVTILMLMVGAALFVWYSRFEPTEAEAALFALDRDNVFPVWITTALPVGLTGLVLAGAFAAAISSMDSALAALSQTSLSLLHGKEGLASADQRRMITQSRIAVVAWAAILALFAVGMQLIKEQAQINLILLALGIVAYTYGTMLAIFLLALFKVRVRLWSLWLGLVISVLLTAWIRPDVYVIAANVSHTLGASMASIRPVTIQADETLKPWLSFAWLYPINCAITLACGLLFRRRTVSEARG